MNIGQHTADNDPEQNSDNKVPNSHANNDADNGDVFCSGRGKISPKA